jgi:hypothetical protein
MTRKDSRRFSSGTTDTFGTVGDYATVANASGQPSSSTQTVGKREVAAAATPEPRPGRRGVTQIGGRDGEGLRDHLDRATTAAVRQARMARAVEETQAGPRTLDMMRHLFGV